MNLAEKIITLRKEMSWSQEDLANEINVSRQAVSKWEQNQSVPDMDKIIKMSELFKVSVDSLVKDDIEIIQERQSEKINLKSLNLEDAQTYLTLVFIQSKKIAFSVMLFILSPVVLIILTSLSELNSTKISENSASAIGLIILFSMISVAIAIIIITSSKIADYQYLDSELLRIDPEVKKFVNEARSIYKTEYTKKLVLGIVLCVLSVLPLFIRLLFTHNNQSIYAVPMILFFVSIGVYFLIESSIKKTAYEKLLQEGEFTKQNKLKKPMRNKLSTVYWLLCTTIFLAYSFITRNWGYSWIIYALAGIMYPLLLALLDLFTD